MEDKYLKLSTIEDVADKIEEEEGKIEAVYHGAYDIDKGEEGEVYQVETEHVDAGKTDGFYPTDLALIPEFDRRRKLNNKKMTFVVEFSEQNVEKYGKHILFQSWEDHFELVTDDKENNRIIYERDDWDERIVCHLHDSNHNIIKEVEFKDIEDTQLVSEML